ncbi:porin [Algoriphagus jejuensis]|uniref:Porin n=1 Tax=Algoriphagus jejuensis TaxID=419934 RepID=A0ABN1Z6Q7_9BACT
MRRILRYNTLLLLTLVSLRVSAQEKSDWQEKPAVYFSGFADLFYVYDFNQPTGTSRQSFLYNHNRHNEFNLNLGLLKVNLSQARYRASLALQTGTYPNDNYAKEPGVLKSIAEASVGISLNKSSSLWLDMGILPSPIGFESAISMDDKTLTRSLLAENSPYFLTGAKLSFRLNENWEVAGLVVNGWQRIQRLEGNSLPSFSTQVSYRPKTNVTLNWSTFLGTDDPDSTRRMRYFSNTYGIIQVSDRMTLIAGFDIGAQQQTKGGSSYDVWFSPTIITQFAFNQIWKTALRAEYYQDANGVIVSTDTPNGFRTSGFSWNLDYSPTQWINWRLEVRWLGSKDDIFPTENLPTDRNWIVGTSLAFRFLERIDGEH